MQGLCQKKCQGVSGCQCPKEYPAKGATKGKRTKKSGQSPYFVGHKKHTLRLWLKIKGKNRLIPLVGFIEPANVYEGNLLGPMIQETQEDLSLHIDAVLGDMGYISADQKKDLRKQWQTAALTKIRENMPPRKKYLDYGCPEGPEGFPLSWDGYNPDLGGASIFHLSGSSCLQPLPSSGKLLPRNVYPLRY